MAIVCFLEVGCASTGLILPEGPSRPFADYQGRFNQATGPCQRVRTMQVAMRVNAESRQTTFRGEVLGALSRPASLRLVGVAPFGLPGFILVATLDDAPVLVLPREKRVVTATAVDDLLSMVAGVSLSTEDFLAVLTGCVVPAPEPQQAKIYENGWIGVKVDPESTAYLQTVDNVPVIIAGRRPGLTAWYSDHVRGLPRRIDLRARDDSGRTSSLTVTLSQLSVNIDLQPEIFSAETPDDYVYVTLEEFQSEGETLENNGLLVPPQ